MPKIFIKTKEDFICGHCGASMKGNGYTNHCSKCLWSKHVDLNPGDRAGKCQGMMRPEQCVHEKDRYMLIHVCEKCGAVKRNRLSPEDSFEEATRIQAKFANR